MTSLDSKLRGFIYVAIAILAFAGTGVPSLPISDEAKTWIGFFVGTTTAGLVALRAYIDQSSSQVAEEKPAPEPEKKPYQS